MSEEKIKTQNGEGEKVNYAAIEMVAMFADRDKKRLWIIILVLIAAFIISNALWIYRDHQTKDIEITQEVEQDTDDGGDNSFIGGDYYGETTSKDDNQSSGEEKRQS